MPWKETNIMQQRIQFIQAWLTKRYTKVELCKQFNISRPTADKWIKRHQQVGFDGLAELSRRPQHSPHATPQWISEWLIAQKLKRPDWGAKKLLDLFARTFPEQHKPADSTGDLILARAGLVKPRKRRRKVSADSQPFNECTHANSTWCADFKGQFTLGNRKLCYPLTVTDHFSRYLFMCQALSGTQSAPFASTALGGITRLSKWWIDLGIRPERIQPAHPEQNGRHERMHRSLKDCLYTRLDKMEQDLRAQQVVFDAFIHEYNHERSHEGIGRKTPSECYTPSNRLYTGKIVPYDYGEGVELRQVKGSGEIKWKGKTYYLSQVLAHEAVAFVPYADGVWHIFYRFHFLGQFDEREGKIIPATSWHAKPLKP